MIAGRQALQRVGVCSVRAVRVDTRARASDTYWLPYQSICVVVRKYPTALSVFDGYELRVSLLSMTGYTITWSASDAATLVARHQRDRGGQVAACAVAGHHEPVGVDPELRRVRRGPHGPRHRRRSAAAG
jgi:hypothetical protein